MGYCYYMDNYIFVFYCDVECKPLEEGTMVLLRGINGALNAPADHRGDHLLHLHGCKPSLPQLRRTSTR
jgi:hypothetical protein